MPARPEGCSLQLHSAVLGWGGGGSTKENSVHKRSQALCLWKGSTRGWEAPRYSRVLKQKAVSKKGGRNPAWHMDGICATHSEGTLSSATKVSQQAGQLLSRGSCTHNCLCCSLCISTGWAWFPGSINHSVLQTFNLHIHNPNICWSWEWQICVPWGST